MILDDISAKRAKLDFEPEVIYLGRLEHAELAKLSARLGVSRRDLEVDGLRVARVDEASHLGFGVD